MVKTLNKRRKKARIPGLSLLSLGCRMTARGCRLIHKAGARGLRAILEGIMLDVMFDVPSEPDIKEVMVSEDTIVKGEKPLVVYQHAEST